MTRKKKRRLRIRLPKLNLNTSADSSGTAPVRKRKRKRRRFRLKKEAYMVLAGIAAILALIFIPRAIDNSNLKKLGYDKATIKNIREQKLTKTILSNEWYSNYLAQAINDGTLNKDYTELYTVVTPQRGLNDTDFLLYGRLKDKGYSDKQLLNLYNKLRFIDLTPLLVFDYQSDESAYIADAQAHMSDNDADHFELDGTYYTPYENTRAVDDPSSLSMLVNKTYYLDESYVPDNLTGLSNLYAAPDRELAGVAAEALAEWCNGGRANDVYFYATSAYRPYEAQEELYEGYIKSMGQEQTDAVSARPGFSEHQTGYTVDLAATHEDNAADFSETRAYRWANEHCWEYGWLLRYPDGKTSITNYEYESWHYRYVGKDVAAAVHASGLTFDEFYMLYLKPWDNESNMPSEAILASTDYTKLIPAQTAPEEETAPETTGEPESSAPAETEAPEETEVPEASASPETNG